MGIDYIFIINLGMGVKGAALATIIAQMLATAFSLFYILSH